MKIKLLTILCLLIGLTFSCSKSTTSTSLSPRSGLPEDRTATYDKAMKKTSRKMKKGSVAPTTNAFSEARRKEYKKLEKIKDKPQYTDPSYFGHKKKPKKRKRGKRKFCKECGMVH